MNFLAHSLLDIASVGQSRNDRFLEWEGGTEWVSQAYKKKKLMPMKESSSLLGVRL